MSEPVPVPSMDELRAAALVAMWDCEKVWAVKADPPSLTQRQADDWIDAILSAVLPLVLKPAADALNGAMTFIEYWPGCDCDLCSYARPVEAVRDQLRALGGG